MMLRKLYPQQRDALLDVFPHVPPLVPARKAGHPVHVMLECVEHRLNDFRARVKAPHVAQAKRFQPADADVRVQPGPHALHRLALPMSALQNEALSGQAKRIKHVAK